jgi:hypothetical protein
MPAVRMRGLHLQPLPLALLFLVLFHFLASGAPSTQSQQEECAAPFIANLNDKQALYNTSGELLAPIPSTRSVLSPSEVLFLTDKELLANPTFMRDIPLLVDPLEIVANINTLANNLWGPNGENLTAFLSAHPHVIVVGGAVMHAASTHPTRGKGTSDIDIFVLADDEEVLYETLRAFVASFTLLDGERRRKIVVDRFNVILTFTVEGCENMMIQIVKKAPPMVEKDAHDNEREGNASLYARKGLEPFLTSALLTADTPLVMVGIGTRTRGDGHDDEERPAGERKLMLQASVETLYGMETGLVRYWPTPRHREVSFPLYTHGHANISAHA